MRFSLVVFCSVLLSGECIHAQQAQQFSDPVALLQEVAKTYAADAATFRMEAIEENVRDNEYLHERRTVYRTAIKGPGKQYRIETRSGFGSYIQVSDGETEWISSLEGKSYVKEPVPANWPTMPQSGSAGSIELRNAWRMGVYLKAEASNFKGASFLPEETIQIEGHAFLCYVVHVVNRDSGPNGAPYSDFTIWIDKKALVFRKQVQRMHAYEINSDHHIRIPFEEEIRTVYPVTDFQPKLDPALFHFSPPADSKVAGFVGKQAPDVRFLSKDGSRVSLKSYEGKPVLIDFWATWCSPCLQAMPSLAHLYADAKDKGLVLLSVDEDQDKFAEKATTYLAQHHYDWTNYHDDGEIRGAFWMEGIPLVVLIDSKGKIVYYDFGGNDAGLRSAIAELGPEFSSIKSAAGQ